MNRLSGFIVLTFIFVLFIQSVVNADIEAIDNLKVSGKDANNKDNGIVFNDGIKQTTASSSIGVYDYNDNYLGILLGSHLDSTTASVQISFYLPSLSRLVVLDNAIGGILRSTVFYYQDIDCAGQPYVYVDKAPLLLTTVNKYYIAENMKPIDLISFNSYTSYAGVGISCVNFQSPFGTANYLPVVEVTNQLPFSFPIAMPLKFH